MSLKALRMRKQIDDRRADLRALEEDKKRLLTREAELEKAIGEAGTAEDQQVVDTAIDDHETEVAENEAETARLEAEITQLERDLQAAEESQGAAAQEEPPAATTEQTRNDRNRRESHMSMTHREKTRETLHHTEVRTFYETLSNMARRVGSLDNTDLLVPEIVLDRIHDRMGDYTTVAKEVETIRVGGTLRVVLDGADPEAIWVEMSGALSELEGSFGKVELDGWKLGGYMAIPNDIIEDSFINLAEYVERKLAKAIAKARDKAILNGTGSTGKQMVGIIPSLAATNKPAAVPFELGVILSQIGLVDDGTESYGEIIAVMKRSTFYAHVVPNLITVDSAGRYIAPNVASPNLAGLRVVLSQYMPENKILFGDFKRYMMAERSGLTIATSTDVKFIEDQTVIKGLQRMDGKPVHVDENGKTKDWVLVEIDDT